MSGTNGPSRTRRFLRSFVIALIVLLVIVVVTPRVQRWVLRNRAEQLLTDLQEVELRKTSFDDVVKLYGHWRKWSRFEGQCTTQRCQIFIRFGDFFDRRPGLSKLGPIRLVYFALGGRPTHVYAAINVLNGVVWEKSFGVASAPRGIVSGETSTVSRLPAVDKRFALHPNHTVVPYRMSPCVWISAKFTPYEDPTEIPRLMEFDLKVITDWGLGHEERDVMPTACAEAREEQHLAVQPTGHGQPDLPRHESLEYLARDAGRVGVVGVISKPRESSDSSMRWKIEARLEEPWNRYSTAEVGTVRELHLHCGDTGWTPEVQIGQRYLIFTDWDPTSDTVTCGGIVPVTDENVAATRRGIAQDYEAVFGESER
jgi:hypothetical protein